MKKSPQWEKMLGMIWNKKAGPSDFTAPEVGIMQYNRCLDDLKKMGWKITSETVKGLDGVSYKRHMMVANYNLVKVAEYYSAKQGKLF